MNKQQLAARIWESTNRMRSQIEASEYKAYILGLLFYKFLSDREEAYLRKTGRAAEDWPMLLEEANRPLAAECQNRLGYFVTYKHLFSVWAARGRLTAEELQTALYDFGRLTSPERAQLLGGIFAAPAAALRLLSDTESRTQMLTDLLPIICEVPTDGRQHYDVPGFIYEYLIGNFAANAGKKAGEFYTPHEVSVLMSRLAANALGKRSQICIYDPTSGSGSLLITIGKSVMQQGILPQNVQYYAQERKESTYHITCMNLMMHGISAPQIHTHCGDALAEDWPRQEGGAPLLMDAVVANPPYSQQWDAARLGGSPRFAYGTAPSGRADYAFLLHGLWHVKPDGVMTVVLPHGVLFRGDATGGADGRGEGEGRIRRALIEHNHIEAVIGLPDNIFFGTTIPTVILVLRRKREDTDVLFADASDCCRKAGHTNVLTASHIRRIADVVAEKGTVDGFSRLVSRQEICENGYNLNIARYVKPTAAQDDLDLYAAMLGGIPQQEIGALAAYWAVFPQLRGALLQEDGTPYAQPKTEDVHTIVAQSEEVLAFCEEFAERFADFDSYLYNELIRGMMTVDLTAEQDRLAAEISERLSAVPLIDRYEAYRILDDAWRTIAPDLETLQDEGFAAARQTNALSGSFKATLPTAAEDAGRLIPFALYAREYLAETRRADFQTEGRDGTVLKPKNRAAEKRLFAAAAKGLSAASDDEIRHLLAVKWIRPLSAQLRSLPQQVIAALEESVCALFQKYAHPFAALSADVKEAEENLASLLENITGDSYDMQGLAAFAKLLRGDERGN